MTRGTDTSVRSAPILSMLMATRRRRSPPQARRSVNDVAAILAGLAIAFVSIAPAMALFVARTVRVRL
ncbi:MAG TPA: hypothetical protein VER33_25485 [Polyangiaceae bacterium]|nr:hypothetical protein [Polyangiaceae bacterium]